MGIWEGLGVSQGDSLKDGLSPNPGPTRPCVSEAPGLSPFQVSFGQVPPAKGLSSLGLRQLQ